jgi:uncharacterized membrane protein
VAGQRLIVEAAAYTVVTFLATVILAVEVPATGGYFNLGEAAIYSIAFIASTPLVAGVAAGLGPAIADIVLGYGYFAPGTLIIKFAEGYVVAYLAGRLRRGELPGWAKVGGPLLALAIAAVLVAGMALKGLGGGFGAAATLTKASLLGVEVPLPSISLQLPGAVWLVIAAAVAALGLIPLVARTRPYIVAPAVGGVIMVTGYFLYEFFITNPLVLGRDPFGAFFEIPVNVGQVAAGIVLSYPVVRFLERARPQG